MTVLLLGRNGCNRTGTALVVAVAGKRAQLDRQPELPHQPLVLAGRHHGRDGVFDGVMQHAVIRLQGESRFPHGWNAPGSNRVRACGSWLIPTALTLFTK